ncbi:MAG: glycosyltransferase family 2 protein [Victivallaceae bacterium]
MNLPKITVITPSFNQGQFLEQTIKSVLEQDYPNLEYIIMDGGSSDNSVEIIKKYERYLTYWQSQPDGGQSAAINAGFQRATGEILCWLNSDDQFSPGTLKTVGQYFYDHPECEWVSGNLEFRDLTDGKTFIRQARPNLDWRIVNFWVYGHENGAFCPQPSTFWRKSLWERAGGYVREDCPNTMDYELWLRFCGLSGLKILPQVLAVAVMHEECKSIKNLASQRLETMREAFKFAKQNKISLKSRLLLAHESRQLTRALYCIRHFAPRGLLFRLYNLLCGPFLLWSMSGREKMWINFGD